MNKGDMLHGFRLEYDQKLPEIGAVLHRFTYVKNGADLIWLERADDNKTFSIAFKTIPQDDTGVFHILEHSVLNGSEKYPVKEPFVDLLKSSLATFLNAMTFSDKTMYPVSSRNDKDFMNLIDVYMDAVLHPLCAKDPHAYRQEGWHYELDDRDGALRVNGVVYNEMKGAYTSPDQVLENELVKQLFPDNCYGCKSGGYPDRIPDLTYDSYLAHYHRFYHPSNAYIVLDGSVNLDAVLEKLSAFLAPFDRIDPAADIPMQAPVAPAEKTALYPIGPEDDGQNKAILARGWVYGTFRDQTRSMAMAVLTDVLCGSNDAPLTKALLDAGLCEDVELDKEDGVQQPYLRLAIKNADPAKKEEIWALVDSTLRSLAEQGLDRKRLFSVLSRLEFLTREKDFGGAPKGLVYAITSLESWLYGGDPAQNLCTDAVFAELRALADQGGFERLLREVMLEGAHRATITLLPSKTVAEEKRQAEEARLQQVKAGWSEEEIERQMEQFRLLRQRQNQEDTPEQKATLPRLSLRDIPEKRALIPQEKRACRNVTLLHQDQDTSGISYLNLYFDLRDLSLEELSRAAILAGLIGSIATETYDAAALRSETNEKLGRFEVSPVTLAKKDGAGAYLLAKIAVLEQYKQDAAALISEMLCRSSFSDQPFLLNLVRQSRIGLEQRMMQRGNAYAAMHAAAGQSVAGAMREAAQGVGLLRALQQMEKKLDEEALSGLADLARRVFVRSRLTASLTGPLDEGWVASVIDALPEGDMGPAAEIRPEESNGHGFFIPSEIGYAARTAQLALDNLGAAEVASQFLTYDFLWNTVRVKGGAYGTGFRVSRTGSLSVTSYRDPNPAQSLQTFRQTVDALRAFCQGDEDAERYIVSTIGDIDPLLTPRAAGETAALLYLAGVTGEELEAEWRQVLRTDKAALAAFADALEQAFVQSHVCVIGGQKTLDACGDALTHTEPLQA